MFRPRPAYDPCPEDRASICSRLTCAWASDVLSKGFGRLLCEEDVWNMPVSEQIEQRCDAMRRVIEDGDDTRPVWTMARALNAAVGRTYWRAGLILRPLWIACVTMQVECMKTVGT